MARRKRAFLEDDSDSSAESREDDIDEQGFEDDPDMRAERSLFENPYQRQKRRRVNGKDDATYGVFADDDEEEEFSRHRLHFTQAPAFVTGDEKKTHSNALFGEGEDEDHEEEHEAEDDQSQHGNVEANIEDANPVLNQEATNEATETPEEDNPAVGGGGLGSEVPHHSVSAGIASRLGVNSRGGIGSSGRMGLSRSSLDNSMTTSQLLPEAFGSSSRRSQRSFLRDATGSATSSLPGTPKLSREEKLHFDQLQGTFGARLMAKMGWESGTGLGPSAEGIVTPVETKLRPKPSMGLAFRGYKEKTAQSKAEARRRGEVVSDDENEASQHRSRAKAKGQRPERSDAWKKSKKPKIKVEHQTYEQIVRNAGEEARTSGLGKIYDATSGELREVSLADVSASWTPSTDTMRIPEVRHNLRLIVDVAKGDLDGLAREGKNLDERKKLVRSKDARLRLQVEEEANLISRLQSMHLIVDDIKAQSQASNGDYEPSLNIFSPYIDKLVTEFTKEYDIYHLDEVIVAAISPMVRDALTSWEPLRNPTMLADVFGRWKHALKFQTLEIVENTDVEVYGLRTAKQKAPAQTLSMTPYESLMWNMWLPKVRSCINNDWLPVNATPAIQLCEVWSNILPPFIRDNIIDQLVIPKVQKTVAEWQPRPSGPTLQSIVFPWLPHIGLRMEDFLSEAKRKVKNLLRSWRISDGVPNDLVAWKEVFGGGEWDGMILKYILPKLGATLREDFIVNPHNQDMTALERVLQWSHIFRGSVFSQLLETEFFPKWLDVLHVWLIQPKANFEEVADWHEFWKNVFPQAVLDLPGVAEGFTRGLQLMNKAMDLGPNAVAKLPRPDHRTQVAASGTGTSGSHQGTPQARWTPARTTAITFRSIVEEFAASHDLLFIPTGRSHEKLRVPLFKVSQGVDGKGGVLVFILDDAVWAVEGDNYRAICLEEMVLRANKTG